MIYKNNQWVFEDTQLSVAETFRDRPCGKCNKERTSEGHDACLGILPGTMNACCGHGETGDAYVQFWGGQAIQGKDAIVVLDVLKKYSK